MVAISSLARVAGGHCRFPGELPYSQNPFWWFRGSLKPTQSGSASRYWFRRSSSGRCCRQSQKRQDRALFGTLLTLFLVVTGLVVYTYFIQDQDSLEPGRPLETVLMLWSVVPSALLGYFIFRHNFLEIAIRRSFGYPIAIVILVLVYSGQRALSARLLRSIFRRRWFRQA